MLYFRSNFISRFIWEKRGRIYVSKSYCFLAFSANDAFRNRTGRNIPGKRSCSIFWVHFSQTINITNTGTFFYFIHCSTVSILFARFSSPSLSSTSPSCLLRHIRTWILIYFLNWLISHHSSRVLVSRGISTSSSVLIFCNF